MVWILGGRDVRHTIWLSAFARHQRHLRVLLRVFFPPYLTLGDGVDTTKDTSRGNWKKLWVAIQNARRPADFWCD